MKAAHAEQEARTGHRLRRLFLADRTLTARRAAQIIALVTLALVVAAGVLMRYVEPSTFPNVWLGMWWAVQTVTSVGYGDIVPTSVAGRLLAVLAMINGIAFLTVVVATISAAFVETARRQAESRRLLDDPVTAELKRLRDKLEEIERRLPPGEGDTGARPPTE